MQHAFCTSVMKLNTDNIIEKEIQKACAVVRTRVRFIDINTIKTSTVPQFTVDRENDGVICVVTCGKLKVVRAPLHMDNRVQQPKPTDKYRVQRSVIQSTTVSTAQ